jgi:thiosulfate reductase/polysulfide reductase chain A
MKRREFIKVSSLLGTSAAVAPPFLLGGCVASPPPGTGVVSKTPTICDMCFWKCAGEVYKEDGELWKITGNEDDLHSGGRLCTRGTGGPGAYLDRDRLKKPLMRVTVDGRQAFQEVSWDEALNFISGKMQGIAASVGPERLAMLHHGAGGHHFLHLLRAFGSNSHAEPAFSAPIWRMRNASYCWVRT